MECNNSSSEQKSLRVLNIYSRLMNGEVINKYDIAERFGKSDRTIQNDIDDIRAFFAEQTSIGDAEREVVYEKKLNGYRLKTTDKKFLSNSEIFAVCKILLESRAFCKSDLEPIIEKLISNCVPKSKHCIIKDLLANEIYHYIEPRHGKHFIDKMWEIAEAVKNHCCVDIIYMKQDGSSVKRKIEPVGIMFSEYYFYLTAFIKNINKEKEFRNKDDIFPTIYRIDRIQSFAVLKEHFNIPYRDRFEEGEFRKRVMFMYGGKLRRIKFKYTGKCVESILDRLPTARILEQTDDSCIISAEVFGDGVDMWIRSQGDMIEIIK